MTARQKAKKSASARASLKRYHEKRDFGRTPEPRGSPRAAARGGLQYVVQKHDATRLHYDFRLEHNGVLKSWAVPKEPSLNTKDRRLAVQVEDHPLDYGGFEGEIPEAVAISRLDPTSLPTGWHESRDESLRRFGDDWIHGSETAGLLVPSAAIRGEWNVLLNPAHPDFLRIQFRSPQQFEFDARMFR